MEKILDLNKSVAALVKEYPEVSDIMFSLGFTEVKKPAMLNSVGRIMNPEPIMYITLWQRFL